MQQDTNSKERRSSVEQLEEELNIAKTSIEKLTAEIERLRDNDVDTSVQKLMSPLHSLKELERQIFEFQSNSEEKRSALETAVSNLEQKIATPSDGQSLCNGLDDSLSEALQQLNSAKKELAAKLRAIISIKRNLGDMPCQSELTQYERRLSELNIHIQEKLRLTKKYYATYNALLEIKELMLKETSLLNSIGSQFKDAMTSPAGRTKLMDSIEGIVKGSQQKLKKVESSLQEEQKACHALKERCTAATAEQRRCSSLLKAFQEECAKNERLRNQKMTQS